MSFSFIDWWQGGANLVSVAIAYLLAMPVSWERDFLTLRLLTELNDDKPKDDKRGREFVMPCVCEED